MYYVLCMFSLFIVSYYTTDAADRGFEPRLGQTKDYKIGKIVPSPLSIHH